jgi:hypothetical protein
VENKEEVISKLLKFTPEQKKGCILEYLKVMESMDDCSVDQLYKATRVLEDEAAEWKRGINNLLDLVQKNEEEISQLRKQLQKYRSEGGIKRYGQSFEKEKIERRDLPEGN